MVCRTSTFNAYTQSREHQSIINVWKVSQFWLRLMQDQRLWIDCCCTGTLRTWQIDDREGRRCAGNPQEKSLSAQTAKSLFNSRSGQQGNKQRPQLKIRSPWKQGYLQGIRRGPNIWSSSYTAAVGLNLIWEVKSAHELRAPAFKVWGVTLGEEELSIMWVKRGWCKGSKIWNRSTGKYRTRPWNNE